MRVWPATRLVIVLLLLATTVWAGLVEGSRSARDAATAGQHMAALSQLLYGVSALACFWGLLRGAWWTRWAVWGWAFLLTLTATLAPVVWGGVAWTVGAMAGVSTAAAAALVAWMVRAHLRSQRTHR